MGLLDWMKNRTAQASKQPEQEMFLTSGERLALKRFLQHFEDGLVGWQPGPPRPWEADLKAMETRLGFNDPFGSEPVRLKEKEAEALKQFYGAVEKEAEFGSRQVKSDIESLRAALDRNGKPQDLPAWELKNDTASPGIPSALTPSANEPGGEANQKPSQTQSKYYDLYDHPPKTEAEAKRYDALFDMALVVHHIARDPDPAVGKYQGDFERAVSSMREACGFESRDQHPEKSQTNSTARDAGMQRDCASPQQPGKGRSWER